MLLQDLYNDHDTIMEQIFGDDYENLPIGFARKKCHWKVTIDPSNMEYNFLPLNLNAKGTGGVFLLLPNVSRCSDIKPFLGSDNQKYVFGRSIEPKDAVYLSKRKNAFVDLLQTCYDETRIESINTIISFLKLDVTLPENLNDTHCIYFEVIGHENFLENKAVQKFWAKSLYPEKTKDNLSKKQCLVTGEQSEIVDVVKIKIRCSQLSKDGLALITANNEVYEHYGMKQAYNSPISLDAVEKTHNLLNELFRSNKHSKKVGNNVYVFWAEQDPFLLFNDADPETVKEFFESYQSGKIWSDYKLDENDKFKIYGFSNISSRLVIKYANQLSMKQLYKNQHRWLQSIRLYNNGRNEFPELWKLMKAVYRKKDTKNAADYETSIMNSILDGRPLPAFILNTLVRRAILDIVDKNSPGISHTQISLIKACLYDKIKLKGYEMTSEQKDCKDIAYNLGRFWALVEKLQLEALGDRPNASITDKNFTSICTLPSRTIGRLQKNISYYLQLLRKKNVGKSIWLEREIAQVMETISVLPDRLTIEERGMFLIGYFHKQTSLYAPKAESTTETKTGEIENVATN